MLHAVRIYRNLQLSRTLNCKFSKPMLWNSVSSVNKASFFHTCETTTHQTDSEQTSTNRFTTHAHTRMHTRTQSLPTQAETNRRAKGFENTSLKNVTSEPRFFTDKRDIAIVDINHGLTYLRAHRESQRKSAARGSVVSNCTQFNRIPCKQTRLQHLFNDKKVKEVYNEEVPAI